MKQNCQSGKKSNKLLLFAVFFIVLIIAFSAFLIKTDPVSDATSTVGILDEIWDETANQFNQKATLALYEKLGGSNVTGTTFKDKFDSLMDWANTAPRTSFDFRSNNGDSNVTVKLGGKEWVATYLTVGSSGDLSLTLMLANIADNKSEVNKFSRDSVCKYPSDSYGSSFVRASLISGNPANLGSTDDSAPVASYAASYNTSSLTALTSATATALGNEFAKFTAGALSNYILTPEDVGYQEKEGILVTSPYDNFPCSTSNDAYGAVSDANFSDGNSTFNYYTNTTVNTNTYTRWKGDKIWLPSITEVGTTDNTGGIWKTDSELRNITGANYYWLRSSGYSSYNGCYVIWKGTGSSARDHFQAVTTADYIRPAIHLNLSATAAASSSGIKKPTKDSRTFTYDGTERTYTPVGIDSSLMTVTGNKQTNVKILDGSTSHEADPDGYEVSVSLKGGYNWYGGSTDPVTFDFVIEKGDLDINIKYDGQGADRYVNAGLPKAEDITFTGAHSAIDGAFSWDPVTQSPSVSKTQYTWKFTPDDLDNWNVKNGSETINFKEAAVKDIAVELNTGPLVGNLYDRFDTETYANFESYVKAHLRVYKVYEDGSKLEISASDYTVTTKQSQIMVTAGAVKEQKNIQVTVPKSTGGNYAKTLTTDVYESTIEGAMIQQKSTLVHEFVYPMTVAEIKENYVMSLAWNFAKSSYLEVDPQYVTVAVKASASNPSAVVKAGTIDLTFTFNDNGRTKSEDLIDDCTLAKGTYDISGVTLASKSEQYDGSMLTLAVSGDVKDGKTGNVVTSLTASYVYKKGGAQVSTDGVTEVGTYDVIASFVNGDTDNYENISDTLTATLTVTNLGWDMSGVTFDDDTITYDGNFHELEIGGTLPDNSINVTYKYEKDGVEVSAPNGVKDAGVYTVTASFSNPDPTNYADIQDKTATLTINKANVDMSGVSFNDRTVTANGSEFTLEISGNLPHPSIVVTYTVAGSGSTSFKDAGTYEFTASFSNPDPNNYNNIDDMTATLTIETDPNAVVDPPPAANNGPSFLDKIKELIDSGFPLWQIATMAVAGLLTVIFLIKSIQYGNRRKKIVGNAKKNATKVAGLLPVFSSEVVLAGLSNQIWSIMAFAFVGLALIMFIVALVTRKAWKKAEAAHQEGETSQLSQIMQALQQGNQLMPYGAAQGVDSASIIEEMRREMEAQRREDEARRREMEERHREEMARRDEEQAKRDEAMKLMLARMMGRAPEDDGDMPYYGTVDDTDLLVQKVIAGLLPAVQQMIPETTAYLTAPAYEQSASDIEAIADRVAEKLGANIPAQQSDNSDEIRALTDEMKDLKKQLAKEKNVDNSVNVDEIVNRVTERIPTVQNPVNVDEIVQKVSAKITPVAQGNVNLDDLAQKVSEKITPVATNTTVVQDVSDEKMQSVYEEMAQMRKRMEDMSFMSV
ncbi:MAG: DUF6273 domain-containing protein, partial [[Eubacterium] siraeum]|nr:DUF6273 domain-containing protein [[Eubacterium] siraeum]